MNRNPKSHNIFTQSDSKAQCPWASAILSLCLGVLVVLSGCSDDISYKELQRRYQAQYLSIETKLRNIAKTLPSVASTKTPASPLNPAPYFYRFGSKAGNFDYYRYNNLVSGNKSQQLLKKVRLPHRGFLQSKISTLSPSGSIYIRAYKNKPGASIASIIDKEFKDWLKIRYVAIVRFDNYIKPRLLNPKQYSGSALSASVFLTDLNTNQVVCSFSARSVSDKSYSVKISMHYWVKSKGEYVLHNRERILEKIKKSVILHLQLEIDDKLKKLCGLQERKRPFNQT